MGTREQIIDTANRLFYEQGFEQTSFTSIAEAVGISRGNFYYHFKTKDEILDAVIDARIASRREMLADWDQESDPRNRIRRFVEIVITNQGDIENYGCPVGTLTSELAKLGHPLRGHAVQVFEVFRNWLREQFEQLGASTDAEADALAMHFLSFSQGVAALSNAFHDRDFVEREVERMNDWLTERLPPHRHGNGFALKPATTG